MNHYSDELKNSIKKDYLEGIDFNDIVTKYNLERQVVRYILKKANVYKPTKTLHKWTDEEIELLKKYYEKYDFGKIDELLCTHPHKSIVNMCHKLRLTREQYRKNNKIKMDSKIYSKEVIYPVRDVISRNKTINIRYPIVKNPNIKPRADWYTKDEMDFIIQNYKTMSDKEMGEVLGRTPKSIQAKRLGLGIKRQGTASYIYLQDFLRKNNHKWKRTSMQKCGYKCVLTGNRFDEIHHIVGFNYILDTTLSELNFGFVYDARYYTDVELKMILEKFREVQDRHPLGVCLTKEMHEKFHAIYGYGNNTQEQWDEFYKSNKIS